MEYVVVAHPKHDRSVWEPVHPGHMDRANADKLAGVLTAQRITHEVWTLEEWHAYEQAQLDEITCPKCGLLYDDCPGHEED